MTQALSKSTSFDQFIDWYPAASACRYELHRGEIVEMPKPKGKHSEVAGFIGGYLFMQILRLKLPYFIPRECIIRAVMGESGYEPDVIVLDRAAVAAEPRWERESIITLGQSVKLAVEVVSTNWRDDYLNKLADYEALSIPEYWVVDYAALGGRLHIGFPKQPTISVYRLIDGEYEVQRFRGNDPVVSVSFGELGLTAEQIFEAES